MRFKVGQKVRVVKPRYGCYFRDGDVVEIHRIEAEDGEDMNRYGARYEDGRFLFSLYDDEVEPVESEDKPVPITNGDKIRAMSNAELSDLILYGIGLGSGPCDNCQHKYTVFCHKPNRCEAGMIAWLNSEAEDK